MGVSSFINFFVDTLNKAYLRWFSLLTGIPTFEESNRFRPSFADTFHFWQEFSILIWGVQPVLLIFCRYFSLLTGILTLDILYWISFSMSFYKSSEFPSSTVLLLRILFDCFIESWNDQRLLGGMTRSMSVSLSILHFPTKIPIKMLKFQYFCSDSYFVIFSYAVTS